MMKKVSFLAMSGLTVALAVGAGVSLSGSGGCGSSGSTTTSDLAGVGGDQASGPVGFTSIYGDIASTCAISVGCHTKAGNTSTTTLLIDTTSGVSMTNYNEVLTFVNKGNAATSPLITVPDLMMNAPSNNQPHAGGAALVGNMKTKWIAWINNQAPFSP